MGIIGRVRYVTVTTAAVEPSLSASVPVVIAIGELVLTDVGGDTQYVLATIDRVFGSEVISGTIRRHALVELTEADEPNAFPSAAMRAAFWVQTAAYP